MRTEEIKFGCPKGIASALPMAWRATKASC
jgi:hypothetical protein